MVLAASAIVANTSFPANTQDDVHVAGQAVGCAFPSADRKFRRANMFTRFVLVATGLALSLPAGRAFAGGSCSSPPIDLEYAARCMMRLDVIGMVGI